MDVETNIFLWRWARDYKDYKLQKINGQRKGRREGKGRKEGQRKEGGHTRSFCDSSEEGLGSERWHALHLARIIAQASS